MKNCINCHSEMPNSHDVCWKCNFDHISGKVLPPNRVAKETEEIKSIHCLRCQIPLQYQGSRKFHEGTNWGMLGDLGHLLTNSESFDLYICPSCKKIEFYAR